MIYWEKCRLYGRGKGTGMKKIKLSLPPEGFTVQDAYDASKREGSLSQIVMDIIVQNRKELKLRWREKDSPRQKTEGFCEAINKNFQETREEIDQKVMDYLLRHDGKADSWPDCAGLDEMNWEDVQTGPVAFDYFGDDYQVTGPHSDSELYIISRKQDELVYHNTYIPEHLPAYNAKREEISRLDDKFGDVGDGRRRCLALLCLLFFLLLLPFGFASFALLSEMLSRSVTQGPFRPVVLGWIAKLGEGSLHETVRTIYQVFIMPAEEYMACGTIGRVIYALVTFGLTLIPLGLLLRHLYLLHFKRKMRRLEKSLADIEKEDTRWMENCREISRQWHQAWFKWAQEYKMRPGMTQAGCLLRGMSADEERELREEIRSTFGVEATSKVDIQNWEPIFLGKADKYAKEMAENGETDIEKLPRELRAKIWRLAIGDMVKTGYATELPPDLGLTPEEAERDAGARENLKTLLEVEISPRMPAEEWMELFDERWEELRNTGMEAEEAKARARQSMIEDGLAEPLEGE